VSKDVPPLHCVGGVPAKDLTEKIVPFREVTLEEKFDLMKKFVHEFLEEMFPKCHEAIEGGYRVVPETGDAFRVLMPDIFVENTLNDDEVTLVFTKTNSASSCSAKISIFDLSTKQYIKRRTDAEIQIIKFMNGYRARFVPANYPCVI
jgi:hypothetical protein